MAFESAAVLWEAEGMPRQYVFEGVVSDVANLRLQVLSYAAFLVLRYEKGWRGRRAAYLALAGFAFVVVVRLGLPITHFA